MTDPQLLLIIAAIFLLAGIVKGIIGLGLPTISLALITVATDLKTAMTLLIVPAVVTNIWQAFSGKGTFPLLQRIWLFLLCAAAAIFIGSISLRHFDLHLLSSLLGVLLIIYAISSLTGLRLPPRLCNRKWVGAATGLVNGVFTGMTGSFVVPAVIYLQAMGFDRIRLLKAMGMLFLLSSLILAIALQRVDFIADKIWIINNHALNSWQVSSLAVIPALFGVIAGLRIGDTLSERGFRRVFFIALLAVGVHLMIGG